MFHAVYFVLLTILIISQVVSKFMMSGMQILLTVNWLLELVTICIIRSRQNHSSTQAFTHSHIHTFKHSSITLLAAFLILMGVHVVWLIGTCNMSYALDDLFRKLPLLAIPVVILASKPLNRNQVSLLLHLFVITVFVATIIGVVRLLTIPDLPYRDTVPFISNIRFSLNICVAIVLLLWHLSTHTFKHSHIQTFKHSNIQALKLSTIQAFFILWFIFFLLVLRSYTAFIVMYVTGWLMLLIYWRKMGKMRNWLLAAMVTLTVVICVVTGCLVHSYYGDARSNDVSLAECTVNGNAYSHANDGLVENGNIVNNYICREELESQWQKRSAMSIYDTTANTYTVFPTLVRYLNAKGLTKDSVGVAALTDEDVARIEKGIANPVYVDGMALKKMMYVLLFEYENYRVYGNIRNSSMLERVELWRGAWRVFCDNPLFGVGTGDGVDELHRRLQADGSQIADTEKHAHNQYLTFLVSFGLVGFLLIAIAFYLAFRKIGLRRTPAYLAIIIILLLSFISEDTLETLAGCVLCTVIPCLLGKLKIEN